ncbi:MAG: hypothetical protein K1X90_01740 [Candidatus Kapabacteria bacterium]|nr:hypothetical protein [Candidatus Kapabacteria bacterium]
MKTIISLMTSILLYIGCNKSNDLQVIQSSKLINTSLNEIKRYLIPTNNVRKYLPTQPIDTLEIITYTSAEQSLIICLRTRLTQEIEDCTAIAGMDTNAAYSMEIGRFHFNDDTVAEYSFLLASPSSTYGYQKNFVIWYDGIEWRIIKDPLLRAEIIDWNNDGIMEFYETYNTQGKDSIFCFDDGWFKPVQLRK